MSIHLVDVTEGIPGSHFVWDVHVEWGIDLQKWLENH